MHVDLALPAFYAVVSITAVKFCKFVPLACPIVDELTR